MNKKPNLKKAQHFKIPLFIKGEAPILQKMKVLNNLQKRTQLKPQTVRKQIRRPKVKKVTKLRNRLKNIVVKSKAAINIEKKVNRIAILKRVRLLKILLLIKAKVPIQKLVNNLRVQRFTKNKRLRKLVNQI